MSTSIFKRVTGPTLPHLEDMTTSVDSQLIDRLPDEILLHIFSFITYDDIEQYVLPVCSRWSDLGSEPCLWSSLIVSKCSKLHRCKLKHQLKKVTNLKTFTCLSKSKYDSTEILEDIAVYSRQLKSLIVPNHEISSRIMSKYINECQTLKSIDIFTTKYFDYRLLAAFKNLTSLKLRISGLHTKSNDIEYLIKECNNLEEVSITLQIIEPNNLKNIINHLKKQLRSFNIILPLQSSDSIVKLIGLCSHLNKLSLFVHDDAEKNYFDPTPLKNLSKLEYLHLCGYHSPESNMKLCFLFNNMTFENLQFLKIEKMCPETDFLTVVANNVPKLRTLCISYWENLTDLEISTFIAKCPSIGAIILRKIGKSFTGCSLAKYIPTLKHLKFKKCKGVSSDMANEIEILNPWVNFVYDGSVLSNLKQLFYES